MVSPFVLNGDVILPELARAALAAALFGCLQSGAGIAALARFTRQARHQPSAPSAALPPVSVLKPLYGNEPMLRSALESIARQDYPAMQIVLGVQSPIDPAIEVARALIAAHPDRDITLVVDATMHGGNGKIGNLINMLPAARHELLVISDSDIHAPPDYLARVVTALRAPGIGLATTIYHGRPARPGLTERLAAGPINHNFLPGNLIARWLGRQDCLGATMALSRTTLSRAGGLEGLLDHVADDGELGRRVRDLGLGVALAPVIVATTVADDSIDTMLSHELRWGRTVRTQEPVGYGLSVLQLPLAFALLAVLLAPVHRAVWTWFAAIWAFRWASTWLTDRLSGASPSTPFWALPLRDAMSAMVMAGSFTSRRVAWRGRTLHIGRREADAAIVTRPVFDATALAESDLPPLGAAATTQTRSASLPTGSMRKTPV